MPAEEHMFRTAARTLPTAAGQPTRWEKGVTVGTLSSGGSCGGIIQVPNADNTAWVAGDFPQLEDVKPLFEIDEDLESGTEVLFVQLRGHWYVALEACG